MLQIVLNLLLAASLVGCALLSFFLIDRLCEMIDYGQKEDGTAQDELLHIDPASHQGSLREKGAFGRRKSNEIRRHKGYDLPVRLSKQPEGYPIGGKICAKQPHLPHSPVR